MALISPLPEKEQGGFNSTKAKVWKVYSGQIEDDIYIDNRTFFAHWSIDLSDKTGTASYQKLVMPLYQDETDIYSNGWCRESFLQDYVEDQIARGWDFGSKKQLCFANIKRAYDASFLTGEFILDDKESCAKHKDEFDRLFKRQAKK